MKTRVRRLEEFMRRALHSGLGDLIVTWAMCRELRKTSTRVLHSWKAG